MLPTSPQQRLEHLYNMLAGQIPDGVGHAERQDRVVMAAGLIGDSQSAQSPAVRKARGELAARVLKARPRAETERIVVAKMAKAKTCGEPGQAAALERQARQELETHPPAVRRPGSPRPVAKASAKVEAEPGAAGLVLVYDERGNPIGVIEAATIQPVTMPSAAGIAKARRPAPRRLGQR